MRPAIIRVLGILVLLNWPVLFSQRVGAQSAAQAIEPGIEAEALRHFQAILRFDTSNPPGNEVLVVDYLKSVLEK